MAKKNETPRQSLSRRYEQGGWRKTAPAKSPAGRNRDADKKK